MKKLRSQAKIKLPAKGRRSAGETVLTMLIQETHSKEKAGETVGAGAMLVHPSFRSALTTSNKHAQASYYRQSRYNK